MGEKGKAADLGSRLKKLERVFDVREGGDGLLKTCYVPSIVLTTNFHLVRKEGITVIFISHFTVQQKPRFIEVQLHALGHLDTKRQGQDLDPDAPSSTAPASPIVTA